MTGQRPAGIKATKIKKRSVEALSEGGDLQGFQVNSFYRQDYHSREEFATEELAEYEEE